MRIDWPFAILAVLVSATLGGMAGANLAAAFDRPTVRELEARPEPSALPRGLKRFHDASEGVTCWRMDGREGISCLPDQWLASARMDDSEATP